MTQHINLKTPFALVDGVLTHVKDIVKGMEIICPECGERLILKEGKKTVKHLAHRGDNNCSGESVIHKYTKEYIYNNLNCITLSEHKVMMIDNRFKLANSEELGVKEKYLEYRLSPEYIPDIYIVLEGNYRVALEICYKNAKEELHLEEIIPSLSLDLVLEIKVDEEDIINMNMDQLIGKAYYVYNPQKTQYETGRGKMTAIVQGNKELQEEINQLKKENKILSGKVCNTNIHILENKVKDLDTKNKLLDIQGREQKESVRKLKKFYTDEISRLKSKEQKLKDTLNSLPEELYGYKVSEYVEVYDIDFSNVAYDDGFITVLKDMHKTYISQLQNR